MVSRLDKFIEETFGHEGGFQKIPEDAGNWHNGKLYGTIWGITARNHLSVFLECYSLHQLGKVKESRERGVRFYRESNYWNPLYDKIADSSLSFRIWDFGINAGTVRAVRLVQEICKMYNHLVIVDGVFGKYTLDCINRVSRPYPYSGLIKLKLAELIPGETEFYTLYIMRLEKYYRSLSNFWKFGNGWLRRLKQVFNGTPDLYEPLKEDFHSVAFRPIHKKSIYTLLRDTFRYLFS